MNQACSQATARVPYRTEKWRFTCGVAGCTAAEVQGHYYLVPFDDPANTTGCIVAITIDLAYDQPGAMLSVRYGEPIRYLPFSEDDARILLATELAKQGGNPAIGPGRLQDNPATLECGWSLAFPYWRFEAGSETWFVTQTGMLTQTIAMGQSGGGH